MQKLYCFTIKKPILILCSLLFILPGISFSQNWTGSAGTDWNNPANWSAWPLNGADVTIDPALYVVTGNHPVINSNSVFEPANIVLQNGASLLIDANLTTNEDIEVIGSATTLIVTGGNLSVGPGNSGRLICDLGGSLIVEHGSVLADERLISGEDALITVNGGLITTGDRLILDLGGHFILNNGTVQVAQTFSLADGNLNGSCYFEQHGGVLNVTGEMALENETGNFEPTFFMDGGTFTMNGSIVWFGEAPGSGRPRFIAAGGVLSVTGSIENLPASTVNLQFEMHDSCNASFANGSIILSPGDSVVQVNHALCVLDAVSIQNNGVVHSTNSEIEIENSSIFSGSGVYDLSTLTLALDAVLSNNASSGITIKNNLVHNGQLLSNSSALRLTGSDQVISGFEPVVFYDLILDQQETGTVNLLQDIIVDHHLQLNNGIMASPLGYTVVIENDATSTEGNPTSHISGPVKKMGDDAFVFPIGKNGRWMRLAISAPTSVASALTVEYFNDGFQDIHTVNLPLSAVSPVEYWKVENTAAAGGISVTLYWQNAAESGITSCPDLTVAARQTTNWYEIPSSVSGTCSGDQSGTVTTTVLTSPAPWYTFGFKGNIATYDYDVCSGDSLLVLDNYVDSSGTYIDVVTGFSGTDSTIITHVEMIEPSLATQALQLCLGDSILVAGQYYKLPGVYMDTLVAETGCDSILTTTITLLPEPDLSITLSGVTLAVTPGYGAYSWINCTDSSIIAGENTYTFTPAEDGQYAAIIYSSMCGDTTACTSVTGLGSPALSQHDWSVYPNPSGGIFYVAGPAETSCTVLLYALTGEVVFSQQVRTNEALSTTNMIKPGLYLLVLKLENNEIARQMHVIAP
jgi:hypothetical protein